MLSNYNDAWFMNESIAFYMSTNTFRNPIFDIHSEQDENEIENLSPIGGESTTTNQEVQQQQSDTSIKVDGQHGCRDKRRRFSKLRVAEYSIATRQKLNDFRDNLAFSIKGKIFVLELNFKRCLRRLKKFLDKNLPRISSDKQTRFSNYNIGPNNYDADHFGSCSKLDKYIAINQEKLFWQKVQPNSAKSLGVHQERLLSRLEKAKRDSHRLFNMDNNNFATYFENDHQDTYRTNGSYHYQAASHHMRPNRPASKQSSQARVGAMGGRFAPDVLADLSSSWSLGPSDKLAPKSHSVPASLPDEQAKNGCFLVSGVGGSIKGAKARAGVARKAARPTTTTATKIISSRAGKRKSRWPSSGRQIKQATFSCANSEKLCIVCYNNAPNIVTLPCKHHDICSDCFIEIIYMAVKNGQYPLKCVLCRQKIERVRCPDSCVSSIIQ